MSEQRSANPQTCACHSFDAYECARIRYPNSRVGLTPSIEVVLMEPCECWCHMDDDGEDDE